MAVATVKQTTVVSEAVLFCFVSKGSVNVLCWLGGTLCPPFISSVPHDKITQSRIEAGACLKGKWIPTLCLVPSVNHWHRLSWTRRSQLIVYLFVLCWSEKRCRRKLSIICWCFLKMQLMLKKQENKTQASRNKLVYPEGEHSYPVS